jgi:hypothetical protein
VRPTLITCGASSGAETRHCRDDIVVTAAPITSTGKA